MTKPAARNKWSRYKQLSIRIGSGKDAAEYLKRIEAAMKAARRRTRADWIKFVIDLALEESEAGNGFPQKAPHRAPATKPRKPGATRVRPPTPK